MTGRSPLRGSGLRPNGLSQSPLSQAEPLVPNAAPENIVDRLTGMADGMPKYGYVFVRSQLYDAADVIERLCGALDACVFALDPSILHDAREEAFNLARVTLAEVRGEK